MWIQRCKIRQKRRELGASFRGGGKKEAYRVAGNSPVVGLVAISAGERLEHDGGKSRDADDRIRLGLGSMSTWEGCSG